MQKNVFKMFFNKIFKNNHTNVNIITGGHLSLVKEIKNKYLELSSKTELNKLVITTDEEIKSENKIIEYFQVSKNGEKVLWDNFIDNLKSKNYKVNKLIHLDHLIAFNPLKFSEEVDIENFQLNFNEYSNLARININNPMSLNSLILANTSLLLDTTKDNNYTTIFHIIQPKTFDSEKYFKPNKMLSGMLQNLENSKKATLNKNKIIFSLLNLRTTDKEYIEQIKNKYTDILNSKTKDADFGSLSKSIKEFEYYYEHSLNLLLFILSNDFKLKLEEKGKLLDVKNFTK